jgi:hypothetical protein
MEEIVQMSFITAAVAGFIELVRRVKHREWEGATIIAGAAGIGALAGYLGIQVGTVPDGLIAGLSAPGVITALQKIGSGTRYE